MKNVTFTDDVSSYTDYQFKPQLRTVGPKYGKYLKQIQSVLSELDGNAAMKELKENGCLKLDSVSSEVVLLEEDLLITMTQAEGFVTEGDNNVTVVMDTRLTPELIEEGFVRELISKIQTMRKEAGFEVMDHIAVSYTADEKVTGISINMEKRSRQKYLQMLSLQAHLPDIRKNGALTVRRLRWQWKTIVSRKPGTEEDF